MDNLAQALKQIQDKKKRQEKSNAALSPIPDAQATANPPNPEDTVYNEKNYNPEPDPSSSDSSSTTESYNTTRSCERKKNGKTEEDERQKYNKNK